MRNKVGVLIESDFYEPEIDYYSTCFNKAGLEVHFLSRLCGNAELTFKGHEERRLFKCKESFEHVNLKEYAAIIVPAGMVADRLRYTDDINKLPPACEFLKKMFRGQADYQRHHLSRRVAYGSDFSSGSRTQNGCSQQFARRRQTYGH